MAHNTPPKSPTYRIDTEFVGAFRAGPGAMTEEQSRNLSKLRKQIIASRKATASPAPALPTAGGAAPTTPAKTATTTTSSNPPTKS